MEKRARTSAFARSVYSYIELQIVYVTQYPRDVDVDVRATTCARCVTNHFFFYVVLGAVCIVVHEVYKSKSTRSQQKCHSSRLSSTAIVLVDSLII